MDMNQELKLLWKCKKSRGGGLVGGQGGCKPKSGGVVRV